MSHLGIASGDRVWGSRLRIVLGIVLGFHVARRVRWVIVPDRLDEAHLTTSRPITPGGPLTGRYARRALVIAAEPSQAHAKELLVRLEFDCEMWEDPYSATLELLRRPMVFRAVVLSLQGIYREELAMIKTLRHRLPRLDVFVIQIEGREASLADAMKLGATGIIAEDGLHRLIDLEPAADRPQVQLPVRAAPIATSARIAMAPPISPVVREVPIDPAPQRLSDDYELPTPRRPAQPGMQRPDSNRPPELLVESMPESMPDSITESTPEPMFHELIASRVEHANAPEPVLTSDEIQALLADQD